MGMFNRVFGAFSRQNQYADDEQVTIQRMSALEGFDLAIWNATGEQTLEDLHIQHPWAAEFDHTNKAQLAIIGKIIKFSAMHNQAWHVTKATESP